jgi:alpha-tubulin suppressor-like RCC1 family protein
MKTCGNSISHPFVWCRLCAHLLTMVVAVATSSAVPAQSVIRGWGYNQEGQLGDGTTLWRYSPTWTQQGGTLGVLHNVTAVAGGNQHSVALRSDGTVWTWGRNTYGPLATAR